MEKKRVVITGYGAVTPIGNNVNAYWDSLIQGRSGAEKITAFDVSTYSTQIANQLKIDLNDYFDKKTVRRTSKFILYALIAAEEALKHSELPIDTIAHRVGVEIGSGIGGIEILEEMAVTLKEKGPGRVSPFTVPMMIPDMASGQVAIKLGAKGPNSCSVSACASSAHSLGTAYRLIQNEQADAMITGGTEAAITPLGLASFCAAKSLSSANDEPEKASRPFDRHRNGFVMGEGAGILILESLSHAQKRGATILAEVVGYGSTGDAYHITAPAPEGEGAQRAIQLALNDAQLSPSDVDYINAHGTSTVLNDKNESIAIKEVFGNNTSNINISSTKSMNGHLLGAAGAIEIIACAKAMETGIVPPTINLDTPDPDCPALNFTPHKAVEKNVDTAISNSFGFGGHNAVIAIKKFGG